MGNKPIYVSKPSAPSFEEYVNEIKDIWDTRMFTNIGKKHLQLEKSLGEYLNVPNISLFTNGHLALESAIDILQLEGEVITTPFTFASTVLAILHRGLTPVFCDIKETDYTIDPSLIEDLITDKTCAIMPVHVYGNVCDVNEIERVAQKYNLPVIYDAAHAFGVTKDGIGIGNFGTISMFSFHATKVFHTVEGGALTYTNSILNSTCSKIRNFGIANNQVSLIGTNAKMSEIHAAMGLCNLRHIDEYIQKRSDCINNYKEQLRGYPGLILNSAQEGVKSNNSYFPIRVIPEAFGKSRDNVIKKLEQHNIYPRKYYYPLVSDFPIYNEKFTKYRTPVAAKIADQIITLPLYSDLQKKDIKRICEIIVGN
ncbi:DegT/DnrJ/EryC1/StrS family aminotransferase [Wukongibacter baidiensis]|uniref:DegT/DnrJ/EryC1/StrS family aminotransferase n=1 Tax=Wukongibacter baidiensis TaxID=1723361 RepID=UPI003D7FE857